LESTGNGSKYMNKAKNDDYVGSCLTALTVLLKKKEQKSFFDLF
jgi:hypothetical protein